MRISTMAATLLEPFGTEKGARLLADIGYDAVDYGATYHTYKPFSGLYAASDEEFDDYFRREGQSLRDTGLQVYQAHAPFPTFADDPAERDFMLHAIRRSIRAAAVLQADYLVIHCAMLAGWGHDDDPAKTKAYNYDVFASLLPVARRYGVKLALENMPLDYIPTSTPDDLIGYLDMMNDPEYFVACLDTGHANITGVDCGDFARALGSRLKVLHVHDNAGAKDEHTCPYLGTIKWDDFMKALKDIGYAGTFSLESSFPRSFPEELYLQAEAFQYGVARQLCESAGI